MIKKGIAVDDPLEVREKQIANILELENSMLALKLEREQKERMLEVFKEKLNSIPETDMALERLNRQDEILNDHYQQLVSTLETTKMNNVIEKGDVQIVDLAKVPSRPFSPNHKRDIITFVFLV